MNAWRFGQARRASDREVERRRYDSLAIDVTFNAPPDGLADTPTAFLEPYERYVSHIARLAPRGLTVLDLGAGTARFAKYWIEAGATLIALDISVQSLHVSQRRPLRPWAVQGDIQSLPIASRSIDVVTCTGSLSYGDAEVVDGEILRVLRPGGSVLLVDSLNGNPIYRFNRWIRFRRGQRTRSTLLNMPTLERMHRLGSHFSAYEYETFGAAQILERPLATVLGRGHAHQIVDRASRLLPKGWGFKVVMLGKEMAE